MMPMEFISITKTVLTVDDLSVLLSVPTQQISTMHRKGLIPAPIKIPGCRRLRWHARDINTWLDERRASDQ